MHFDNLSSYFLPYNKKNNNTHLSFHNFFSELYVHVSFKISFILQALAFAMALNEKGRAYMLQKEYSVALLLLLEADKEFR